MGIALDVQGAAAARQYYEKAGVEFHALIDPNYATGFAYVPFTLFADEHGVVQETRGWEERIKPKEQLKSVTEEICAQWTTPGARLKETSVAALAKRHAQDAKGLAVATELASRYLGLGQPDKAKQVLAATISQHDAKAVGRSGDKAQSRLLGQAHLQMARACAGERAVAIEHATLAYYLNPSVGFGKQIARIIAPEKFDDGNFDNRFREGTLQRLKAERREWLGE